MRQSVGCKSKEETRPRYEDALGQVSRACCECSQPSEPAQPLRRESCPAKLPAPRAAARTSLGVSSRVLRLPQPRFQSTQMAELQASARGQVFRPKTTRHTGHVTPLSGLEHAVDSCQQKSERLSVTGAQRGCRDFGQQNAVLGALLRCLRAVRSSRSSCSSLTVAKLSCPKKGCEDSCPAHKG